MGYFLMIAKYNKASGICYSEQMIWLFDISWNLWGYWKKIFKYMILIRKRSVKKLKSNTNLFNNYRTVVQDVLHPEIILSCVLDF